MKYVIQRQWNAEYQTSDHQITPITEWKGTCNLYVFECPQSEQHQSQLGYSPVWIQNFRVRKLDDRPISELLETEPNSPVRTPNQEFGRLLYIYYTIIPRKIA